MADDDDTPVGILPRLEVTRRDALKLLAAAVAAAKTGCLQEPGEEIRPYVYRPPEGTHGAPLFYATAMTIDGFATGLVVEGRQGRPIKIEGNPAHPGSRGATGPVHQASVLDLYHPARRRAVSHAGLPSSWLALIDALAQPPTGDLWLILPPESSPTVSVLLDRIRERHRTVRVVHHTPVSRRDAYRGAQLAFGAPMQPQLELDRAEVVVALDADILGANTYPVRWAKDFAAAHRLESPLGTMNRLYVAEPMPTPTGSLADHHLPVPAGDVPAVLVALVAELDRRGAITPPVPATVLAAAGRRLDDRAFAWVQILAADLAARPGASVVVVGERQPAAVHALAFWLNAVLGNLGRTMWMTEPTLLDPLGELGLADFVAAVDAGQVGTAVVVETNPVYTAPRGLGVGDALARVPLSVHYTLFEDETSAACRWVAPASHYLEAWGDARAWDGTATIIQPLIRPLYDTLSEIELLASLAGDRTPVGLEVVREVWRARLAGRRDFDRVWQAMLSEGVVPGTALARQTPRAGLATEVAPQLERLVAPRAAGALELDLSPCPAIHDGRWAGNAWLQELPRPITKLTWTNAALMSPATARRLGVIDGTIVRLRAGGREVEAPALVVIDHADGAITLELGYGRSTPAQPIAHRLGADAYALMDDDAAPIALVDAVATGRTIELPRIQETKLQYDRDLAPLAELAWYREHPEWLEGHRGDVPSLLPIWVYPSEVLQWAMTIDTTICTGCSSCVVACQAENNVPVVGPTGVRDGRIMHWLRIDTYRADDEDAYVHQPMLCQHCEKAPCEYVCPVFATAHSPDGLNEMIYNRCVGTRFCSNNCPYKVRRFNWFDYNSPATTAALQHNPEVTPRARGVMEKCTFCVQRIRRAEIEARMEERPIRPGEVRTACQQACPTGAIQFGALQHAEIPMVRWRQQPRRYEVLHHLGTQPRVTYLARIRDRAGRES